jgi:hypothetical protein
MRESGIEAAFRNQDPPIVAFRHGGQQFMMGLAWADEVGNWQAADEFARSVRQAAYGGTVVLLSMPGFTPNAAGAAAVADPSRTLMWDRTHLEAVLCGLVALPDLLEASIGAAFFDNMPYATLARLLTGSGEADRAGMATPDRLPPPWAVLGDAYNGIPAAVAFLGEEGWDQPSGIAALDADRLVIVTAAGLVELNAVRGGTTWIMRLADSVNEPLVMPDGSVLVACRHAVVRIKDGVLEAAAGGFDANIHLLAGPDGEPWALSGLGAAFGTEQSTLALTRIGARVSDQHRFDIHFDAQVHTAGWLDGHRFFLAAAGHSAVIDLSRSTRVDRGDWIESPHAYRQHLLVTDRNKVMTAAGNSTGLGVSMFCTNVDTRSSVLLADFTVNAVHGLCAAPDGTGYLLSDVYAARGGAREPWPILLRIPRLALPRAVPESPPVLAGTAAARLGGTGSTSAPAGAVTKADDGADPRDLVRMKARGDRKDYALERRPIASGGQADVFRALHKPSGQTVAFKKLRSNIPGQQAVARMRREINLARVLGDNPHVIPVLDNSDRYHWFVMPLAAATADTSQADLSDPVKLRELVTAICDALRPAHALGWIHRDLKPSNLLLLDEIWTVGDWGTTRRPRGQTTVPNRTRAGTLLGTEGFAAPELSVDAHQAGPQADIYSIGQIIGWALRGELPQANIPLLPASGPWRRIAKAATMPDPGRRPATVDELLDIIRQELDYEQPDGSALADELRAAADSGDGTAAAQLFALAARHPDDIRLYTEVLTGLSRAAVNAAVAADMQQTAEVVRAMTTYVGHPDVHYGDAARITIWLHWIEVRAAEADNLDLLQEAADATLTWDAHWDQRVPQAQIRPWMTALRGDQAAVVARALHDHRGAAAHFAELSGNRDADVRIRRAVQAVKTATSGGH